MISVCKDTDVDAIEARLGSNIMSPANLDSGAPMRIGIYIDGGFWKRLYNFFQYKHPIARKLALDGLQEAAQSYVSNEWTRQATIAKTHYFQAGPQPGPPGLVAALNQLDITYHEFPWHPRKRQSVGLKVKLALTCWDETVDYGMVMLVAGSSDYVPLVDKLTGEDVRVLIPRVEAEYANPYSNRTVHVGTASSLLEVATDTPTWEAFLLNATYVHAAPFQPDEAMEPTRAVRPR